MATATRELEKRLGPALGFDENFGGIDLRGCPSLNPLPDGNVWVDERFAPLDDQGSGVGSAALKRFIAAESSKNIAPGLVQVGENQFRVFYRDGEWHADGEANGKRRRYSATDKDALYSKLMQVARQRTTIRELSESQLLQVARIAGAGDRATATKRYMECAIPKALAAKYYDNPGDLINDPAHRNFIDGVCEFIWLHSRLDASDSEAWQNYKAEFIGSRPLSYALLDRCWEQFSNSRNRLVFDDFPRPQATAPGASPVHNMNELEDASDAEIQELYQQAARESARGARR